MFKRIVNVPDQVNDYNILRRSSSNENMKSFVRASNMNLGTSLPLLDFSQQ